jgi:hypothetical protein
VLFATPEPDARELAVLAEVEELKKACGTSPTNPTAGLAR